MKPPIRLLAIDIDGTLLDPQFQISSANLEALRRAHRAGVELVLVTGRRHAFALPIAEQLGFDLWMISSNGAVTRSTTGEHFHCDLLPAAIAARLLDHMREFRRHAVLTFEKDGRGALVLETTEELNQNIRRWLEKNAAFVEFVVPIERALTEDPVQAMFCGTIAHMKRAQERLFAGEVKKDVTVVRTEYPLRDLSIVDVLQRGCCKGQALKRWATHRGIGREQIVAIGDNYNDIEMLEFAGVPVIMGNAADELKQNGWRVTLSNEQSGVAAALEQVLGI